MIKYENSSKILHQSGQVVSGSLNIHNEKPFISLSAAPPTKPKSLKWQQRKSGGYHANLMTPSAATLSSWFLGPLCVRFPRRGPP